jgi:hypothetical protein
MSQWAAACWRNEFLQADLFERPPQEPGVVPRLEANGPKHVWSREIAYVPTSVGVGSTSTW